MDSRSPRNIIFEVDTKSGHTKKPATEIDKNGLFLEDDLVYPHYEDTYSSDRAQCLEFSLNIELFYIYDKCLITIKEYLFLHKLEYYSLIQYYFPGD